MEFQKLLEERRTVRKYSADGQITREQVEKLIQAAQEAPSWKNSQTGRYYCVLSEEITGKIRQECMPGANNAVKSEHAALIVTTFVNNRARFQTDGTPDTDADKIRQILNIPETDTIVSVIAVGKPAEEPLRPKRKDIAEIAKFF